MSRNVLRHGIKWASIALVTIVAGFVPAAPAWAYWNSSASAQAAATTGTLRRPVDVTVTAAGISEVAIAWSIGVGTVNPLGFYVERQSGSSTDAACGSSPTKLIEEDGCTDLDVPDGDHAYVVTAVYRSWAERSTTSEVITVLAPLEPEIAPGVDQTANESTPTPTATAVEVTAEPEESSSPSPTPGSGSSVPTPTATSTPVVGDSPSGT